VKQSTKKILGFDSWTKGYHHLERLLPAFAERGLTLTLVHLGSWGNEPGRPTQEKIGALEVRDISFYGGGSFEKVLEIEQPEAVIFLSTQTFAHRAFVRYCHQKLIPTLHLYHGLVNVQVTNDQMGSYKLDKLAYVKFVSSKLGKLTVHTLPCYVNSLLKTKAISKDWMRFILDVMRMAAGKSSLIAADDAKTSRCAVYTDADIEQAVRTYGFETGEVIAVGNPDLMRFGFTQPMLGRGLQRHAPHLKKIMYIDTGLVATGLVFAGRQAFIDHLISTSRTLVAQGKTLLLKPHPAHNHEFLQKSLDGSGIELISNQNFLSKLQECAACIVETTTLALVPALMGMPLLYANYNELEQLRFGPILTSYPRGYMLESVSDVSEKLRKDAEEFDPRAIHHWIALNAGALPAEEMPDRVANIVKSMIPERSAIAK
jgi:hypothetical protein